MKKMLRINSQTSIARNDLITIASLIPDNSRVLDLGCGTGRLLKLLKYFRNGIEPTGVELDINAVIDCIGKGIPVIQKDLNDKLDCFDDSSYDFVILSRVFQALKRPDVALDEMLRIGRTGIISFLNIGYWRARIQLLQGNMPVTRTLPLQWYDTPNIHLGTISDFRKLCKQRGIKIIKEFPLPRQGGKVNFPAKVWPNLFAATCIFVIQK